MKLLIKIAKLYKQELIILSVALVTIIIFIPVFTYIYFAKDLTTKESIMNRNNTGIVLLDRHGDVFFQFYNAHYRKFVPLTEIPNSVKESVIVAEDKDFYKHPGFSIPSLIAALFANLKEGELSYGGSTITQQLVKSSLLTPRKSILRKAQEIVLAQEIERRFTKNEILEMYLNSVYFGEGAFGIESASNAYFGKQAKDLTLSEASLLAGLLSAPSVYSPLSGDYKKGRERQNYVLGEMVEAKYITNKEKDIAYNNKLDFSSSKESISTFAPHFALMVKDQLEKEYGEEQIARSGFKIHTTLDLDWQKKVVPIVEEQVASLEGSGATNASVVVIDPKTGEIRVLVGSKNWFDTKFGKVNMATTPRQPGSSFKPIVYALALENKLITPASALKDQRTVFAGNYRPENYDKRFRGNVLVRRALANSLNVPAVQVQQMVGVGKTLEFSKYLGLSTITEEADYGLSLVLGTASVKLTELTNIYAMFANKGKLHEVTSITKIEDKNGEVIYSKKISEEQKISEETAFLISSILSDNRARAEIFGDALTINRPAAVKTGTTEDYKDALTIGYTPQFAVGVWVGDNNNKPMNNIAGSLGAAPIWRRVMEVLHINVPVQNFEPPSGVKRIAVCPSSGLLVRNQYFGAITEYFIDGTQPTRYCVLPRPAEASNSADITTNNSNQKELDDEKKDQVVEEGNNKSKDERKEKD